MSKDAFQVAWTTENEKDFITNLGRFSLRGANRSYLLRRYREATAKRTRWGRVDRAAVLTHLDMCERTEVV